MLSLVFNSFIGVVCDNRGFKLSELRSVVKENSCCKWDFRVRVVIRYFIVGMFASLCIYVLRVNHGVFNESLRILFRSLSCLLKFVPKSNRG